MPKRKKDFVPMKRVFANNLYIISIALKSAPLTAFWWMTEGIRYNVIVYFEHTYQIAYLIDCVQFQKPFSYALRCVIIMFSICSLNMILGRFMPSRVMPKGKEKINRAIREMLYAKAKDMDVACYDNPEFYNDYVFAMNNATQRVDAVMETASQIIGNAAMFFVLGGYMLSTDKMSVVFVSISFAATYVLQLISVNLNFNLEKALNPILRKRDYINRLFYLPDYIKEIRLSRVTERLLEDYAETEERVYAELKKKTRKIALVTFLRRFLVEAFLFDFVFLLYLMFLTIVRKVLSFGSLYGLFRSAGWAKGTVGQFADNLTQLQEHSLYIEKIRAFMSYNRTVASGEDIKPINLDGAIELRGVSFAYPSAESETLSDITLTINHGEKVAFVGYNGAGKTTLVKLLMRLYDPCGGEVRYAGEDIRNYDLEEYRALFATLFQDYQIYAATVTQNVLAGNGEPDVDKLEQALSSGGLTDRVSQMPHGADTQLTKEFVQGEELSGGEKQKLAISRSLYRQSPVIILDEPSSALDPIAEYELNNTMLRLGREKTVIFISHRLSTTKMADKIYMFENGRLIESGSHDVLMEMNGKYAEMFTVQSEKYR